MRLTTPFVALKLYNQGYGLKEAISMARSRPTKKEAKAALKLREDVNDYIRATHFIGPKGYALNGAVWTFEKFIAARDKQPGVSHYDLKLPKTVRFNVPEKA